jgi:uracil-DNA glycosylase
MSYKTALDDFLSAPGQCWQGLPFFAGAAQTLVAALDRESAAGAQILPPAPCLLAALSATPLAQTRVVILGQDPYPTPGHAHGLAFSHNGPPPLPRSLGNIFKELAADLGIQPPRTGDLTRWAQQGVLLLNTALSVRAGEAGSHADLGWDALADQVISAVSGRAEPAVFVLWGAKAQARSRLIDRTRHLVLESAHPSPLSARRGFFGSKPFSSANRWLTAHGQTPIDWTLD